MWLSPGGLILLTEVLSVSVPSSVTTRKAVSLQGLLWGPAVKDCWGKYFPNRNVPGEKDRLSQGFTFSFLTCMKSWEPLIARNAKLQFTFTGEIGFILSGEVHGA